MNEGTQEQMSPESINFNALLMGLQKSKQFNDGKSENLASSIRPLVVFSTM
jgi:hypothetical protein